MYMHIIDNKYYPSNIFHANMYHPSNIYSYTFTCNCTIQISADAWYLLPLPPLDEATPSSAAARKWQSPQASGIWATRMEIGKT